MFDVLLKNAKFYDGLSNDLRRSNIAIKDDIISYIGPEEPNSEIICPVGDYLTSPGWIDAHCHSDMYAEILPDADGKVLQGVTTDVAGLCSYSPAPISERNLESFRTIRRADYPGSSINSVIRQINFEEYSRIINTQSNMTNMAMFVGNANLRVAAMGLDNSPPTKIQLDFMCGMLRQALEEGAFGLSSGLNYVPSMFATTEELIALTKELVSFNAIYNSHMRNEGDQVIESVKEVINIAKESGCRGHISHLKCSGLANHGKSIKILEMIEAANSSGIPITFDVYPYLAGSTSLSALLPSWVLTHVEENDFLGFYRSHKHEIVESFNSRDWDNYIINVGPSNIIVSAALGSEYEGLNLQEIADGEDIDVIEAVFKVLDATYGSAMMIYNSMSENDLINFIKSPYCTIGSDAYARKYEGFSATGKPHPRNYGTFPRFIKKYVTEKQVLSISQAIRMLTSRTASQFNIKNRGVIEVGRVADITVFDPDIISDCGTFENPHVRPKGIEHVLVNGKFAVYKGKAGLKPHGKILKNYL